MYFFAFAVAKLLDPIGLGICFAVLFALAKRNIFLKASASVLASGVASSFLLSQNSYTQTFASKLPSSIIGAAIQTAFLLFVFMIVSKIRNRNQVN